MSFATWRPFYLDLNVIWNRLHTTDLHMSDQRRPRCSLIYTDIHSHRRCWHTCWTRSCRWPGPYCTHPHLQKTAHWRQTIYMTVCMDRTSRLVAIAGAAILVPYHPCQVTVDSAFVLYSIINEYLEQGKKLYTFFIDYSKAFDYIVHDNLWYKLLNLGVQGKIIDIIRSMYSQVRTKVFNNNEKSETFTCKLGVRQGECLSPFLFSMYVNDLESHLAGQGAGVSIFDVKFLLLLYADDVVIFSDTPEGLQSQINKLFVYCQRWKLSLNTKKSQIIVFKKGNHPCVHKWYYGDEEISVLRSLSYLGIVFSSNGKVVKTQATLADQANKAIFQLHKILNRFKTLRVSFALDLFDKLITPILCYGCEVWGFHPAPDIERVHLGFLKRVLGVKKSSQNDFIYGLLGRYPMRIIRQCRILSYWLKIVSGKKSRYVNVLYHAALSRVKENDSYNWVSDVKQLLCSIGFGDVWYNQGVIDQTGFLCVIKQRLFDIFKQSWSARLVESPRARFYRQVVDQHMFHRQLDIIPCNYRIALTRLIVSSHRLRVETGRWERPVVQYESRLCHVCHKLDDEYHFLLECDRYAELRARLIPRYYWVRASMYKCIQLLSSNNRKTVRLLSKYVYLAFRNVQLSPCWFCFVLVQCCVCYFVTIICIVTLVGACGLKAINKILDLTWLEVTATHLKIGYP